MHNIRSAAAVAALGSLLVSCTGNGASNSSLPSQPGGTMLQHQQQQSVAAARHDFGANSPQVRDPVTGRFKHVFFSRKYLKMHPEIEVGFNARQPDRRRRTNNLNYYGGPVETTPAIYLIFWGISGPNDSSNDPSHVATYLTNFYSAIGGSAWLNTDAQYYQTLSGTQHIGNPAGQVAGVFYDTSSRPNSTYTDADVANEAQKGVAHFDSIRTPTTWSSPRPEPGRAASARSGAPITASTETARPIPTCRTCPMPAIRAAPDR